MEDIVGPAVEGLKETLGASLEKLWKQRLEELERRERAVVERERQLSTHEQRLREREQELTRREEAIAAAASTPQAVTPWPKMTLPLENEMNRETPSAVPPTPDFGVNKSAATLQDVESARPSSVQQKEPPRQEASKPPASSLFPAKKVSPGLFAESPPPPTSNTAAASALFPSPPPPTSNTAAASALFPSPAKSPQQPTPSTGPAGASALSPSPAKPASGTTASGGLFPPKAVSSAASAQPNSAANSTPSLFPAAPNQPSSNQSAGGSSRSLFPAANVQAPREEESSSVSSKSPPAANVQTPPVAQNSASAVDSSDGKSASELKNVFEQRAQSLKKSTETSRRRSWTPRHNELDLPDGQSKGTFRAHDAPYQARTSFGVPVREKRSLSDLLDEDKRKAELS